MTRNNDELSTELRQISTERSQRHIEVESSAHLALPPVDTGKAAWLFLGGSFIVEMVLWGFPFSFGVLQDYYTTHKPISNNASGASAVGTTCSGIMYLAAPLSFAAFQRWPRFGRMGLFYGLLIVATALLLSSLATSVWHLLLTQGVLYAIGGTLLYYPIFNYIDEWFIQRKGFAFGVMWGGSGVGGLCGPLVLNWGLTKYGAETFLRGWAVAMLVLIGPLLYFVKPRQSLSKHGIVPTKVIIAGYSFVHTPAWWALASGIVFQGLGYFIPALYLPTYARLNHTVSGSLLVSLLNTASVPGVIFFSSISNRVSVYTAILVSSLGSALSVLLLWGLSSTSTAQLIVFVLSYGFFAGGFTGTFAGTAVELQRVTPDGHRGRADIGSIFGLLSVCRGIGNVTSGPLSERLLKLGSVQTWNAAGAYGNAFGPLITFSGSMAALTMCSWLAKRTKLI